MQRETDSLEQEPAVPAAKRDESVPAAKQAAAEPSAKPRAEPPRAEPLPEVAGRRRHPWIVGVGASAGGLEALREFVRALEPSGQFTYVIAQHLSPTHRSMLMELLSRETKLPVKELGRTQTPKPDTVYITAPNRNVEYRSGRLVVRSPKIRTGPQPSVDLLFASLALELEEHAVGVIFSGTGSDGARGIQAIKAAGGITYAQDDSAKYDGMPRAARSTGCIDFVESPGEIGRKLPMLLDDVSREALKSTSDVMPDAYEEIAAIIRTRSQIDFSDYRSTTVLRRIARRMRMLHLNGIEEYVGALREDGAEADTLTKELLIGVTSFFRDPKAFEKLAGVIEGLVKRKEPRDEIRVWVPGCASGEEAYSVAILLLEAMRKCGCMARLQVFASDLSTDALAVGRRGLYPMSIAEQVKPSLLRRYFTVIGSDYALRKSVRDAVLFSRHNLTEDPPFSKLDLVCCRNLLIYFNTPLQRRVLERLHYALRGGGYLFLGKSETVGDCANLFSTMDQAAKIFQAVPGVMSPFRPTTYSASAGTSFIAQQTRVRRSDRPSTEAGYYAAVAQAFGPPTVIVDRTNHPVHISGDVAPYLQVPTGTTRFDVFSLMHGSLRAELKALLTRSRREGVVVRSRVHTAEHKGDRWQYRVEVHPHRDRSTGEDLDLIGLVTVRALLDDNDEAIAEESTAEDPRIEELEHELASMREHLQTMVEELETSNEELQSLNEELQSSNEELQSTNEELETSNEELQSANEELTTVNEEIAVKSEELHESNLFLSSILQSMGNAVIVAGPDLKILRFNAAAGRLLQIDDRYVGRAIGQVEPPFRMPDLSRLISRAVDSGKVRSQRVQAGKHWYQLHVHPCIDEGGESSGAVVIFDDVTVLMDANARLRESEREKARLLETQAAILDSLPAHIALLDLQGDIVAVNEQWRRFAEENGCRSEVVGPGCNYLAVCERAAGDSPAAAEVFEKLNDMLQGRTTAMEISYDCHSPAEERWFRCTGRVVDYGDTRYGAVVMHVNETDRVLAEQSMVKSRQMAEEASTAKSVFLANMSHELRTPLNAIIGFSELQKTEVYGALGHPKYVEYARDINSEAQQLLNMIEEILDLSKVEAGKQELRESFVDVPQCQSAIFKLIEQTATSKGLTLTADNAADLPRLLADEGLLRRMLTNLLSNAIKFTPKGGEIHFESRLDEAGRLVMSVEDNGVGIPEGDLQRIVEPFSQVCSTLTSNLSGVGLGLALVNSLVQLHDGELSIESQLKIGTKVTLRFPPDRVVEGIGTGAGRGAA